jgi:NTE family protein/lysophospholipid hydrolase
MERVDFLRSSKLFATLTPQEIEGIAAELTPVALPAGEVLFRQGDPADALYLVEDGHLAVLAEREDGVARALASVARGQWVGETALVLSGSRSATVKAEEACRLLRLSLEAFQRAMRSYPGLRRMLSALIAQRLPGLLEGALRTEMQAHLSWLRLERGEWLFKRGGPGDAVYVVVQGRLAVVRDRPEGGEEVVAEIGRGEPVGEMALLTHERRAFSVRALRDTDLVRLSQEGFEEELNQNPKAFLPLLRTLVERLRATTAGTKTATRLNTVAVVPLSPRVPIESVIPELVEGLGQTGGTLRLDSREIDAIHGQGAAQRPASDSRSLPLASWLSRQEGSHDFVVYVADRDPSRWSELCLERADAVLLVAMASDGPGLGAWMPLLGPERTSAARELVLLHEDERRPPSGTAAWLDAVEVKRHHHVRLERSADTHRLARFLSGRAVGLVLSGGGARGFAHAGVLRALAEAEVPVDFVGGVSMGAIVGGAGAMGFGHAEMLSLFRRAFVDTRATRGYTLPVVSVFSPTKGERAVRQIFGDTRIEDLWTNFFCVAANITQARLHVFRRGPVWRAMRASGSFPGLLPPVPEKGDLLVDGGLLNNLPIDVMQEMCAGPIIASDVSRATELQVDPSLDLCPSPGQLLRSRLSPGANPIAFPGIGDVLLRSIEIRDVTHRARLRSAATLYIAPPLGEFSLMAVHKLDAIVATGYRHALECLKTLPLSFPRERS